MKKPIPPKVDVKRASKPPKKAPSSQLKETGEMMNQIIKDRLSSFKEYCNSKFPDSPGTFLQISTEVLAFYLGYIDGFASVAGIPDREREMVRYEFFSRGKAIAVKEQEGDEDYESLDRALNERTLH